MKNFSFLKKYMALCLVVVCLLLSACAAPVDTGNPGQGNEANGEGASDTDSGFALGSVVDTSKALYSYEELEADLFELQSLYPQLMRVASAGKTLDGREIYYADIGSPEASRSLMINAGIHGREYMTPMLLMKQLEYHLANFSQKNAEGVSFEELFADTLIRVVPMINPDGIALSQNGLSGLRSEELRRGVEEIYASDCELFESYKEYGSIDDYLVSWKANARGVDLNRNFDIDYWEEMRTGIAAPSAQKYKGETPNSEPETQALARLTTELPGLLASVSIHSQGEIIYWDCGQEGDLRSATRRLALEVAKVSGYGLYGKFETPDATYNDWCTLNLGVPSINVETGVDKCPLPIEQFETIWAQNVKLWETVIKIYNE